MRARTDEAFRPALWLVLLGASLGASAVRGAAPATRGGRAVRLEGILTGEVADDFASGTASTRYYLQTLDSRRYEVRFQAGVPAESLGARVRLSGELAGARQLTAGPGSLQVLAPATARVAGRPKVAAVLFDFSTSPPERPFGVDAVQQALETAEAYYDEVSFGSVSGFEVTVLDWIRIGSSSTGCNHEAWSDAADGIWRAQGIDTELFDYVVYVFPSTADCPWGGVGRLLGKRSFINGYLGAIVHELGHNFGAHHAASCNCFAPPGQVPCGRAEAYGDFFDTMGSNNLSHMSAYHRQILGWMPVIEDVAPSASPQEFDLHPIEFQEGGLRQVLRIPALGGSYYVEYRQPFGFDAPLGSAADGVLVRWVPSGVFAVLGGSAETLLMDADPSSFAMNDAAFTPGRLFSDRANGIHLAVLSIDTVSFSPPRKRAWVSVSFGPTPPLTADCRRPPLVQITQVDPDSVLKRAYDVRIANQDLPVGECLSSKPSFTLAFVPPPAFSWKHKPGSYTTPRLPPGQGPASDKTRRVKVFPKQGRVPGLTHTFAEVVRSNRSPFHTVEVCGTYRDVATSGSGAGTSAATDTPYPNLRVNGAEDAEVIVAAGALAGVSWTSQYATACTLRRDGVALSTSLSGALSQSVSTPQLFELTCNSGGASAVDSIRVRPQAGSCGNSHCEAGETDTSCGIDCGCSAGACGTQAPFGCSCHEACTSTGTCCADIAACGGFPLPDSAPPEGVSTLGRVGPPEGR